MEKRDEGRIRVSHGEQAQRHPILGVTSDLPARAYQHRNALVDGFSKEYGCTLLVWFECHDDLQEARYRELQMKKWKRAWKIELIERDNPQWKDLFETLF